MQTIFAQATARGKSGVAVIRLSGPDAFSIGRQMVGELPKPGCFLYRAIKGVDGDILDRGLVLAFQGPRSFTGEDVVEFQVHGSIAVVHAIEAAIRQTGLARMAEAGEFTRRALLNGALDLTQVEALGDLIASETEEQRRYAQSSMDGSLQSLANSLRHELLAASALVEVTIDFADEEVPVDVAPDVIRTLEECDGILERELRGSFVRERLRDGFEVAIVGAPNAGKSTLINRIAQREVALTSDVPGTTRDVIEIRVDLQGLPVTFLDTAGLREAEDVIETAGIARALERAERADLRVFLYTSPDDSFDLSVQSDDLVLDAKADIRPSDKGISGLTGEGVEDLLIHVRHVLERHLSGAGHASRERHRDALKSARRSVHAALGFLAPDAYEAEVVAVHIRDACRALDELVGAIDVEDVLGTIFSQFCIGK